MHYRETAPDPVELAATLKRLGSIHRQSHDRVSAEQTLSEAAALFAEHAPQDERLLATQNELAMTLRHTGRFGEAVAIYEDMIERAQEAELDDMTVAIFRFNAASAMGVAGRPNDAIEQMQQTRAIFEARLPPNHPNLATVHSNLAMEYSRLGNLQCAVRHARQATAIDREVLPDNHPNLAMSVDNLAEFEAQLGDLETSETLLLEARSIVETAFPEGGSRVAEILFDLAELRFVQGRFDESIALYREGLVVFDGLETHREITSSRPRLKLAAALRTQALRKGDEGLLDQAGAVLEDLERLVPHANEETRLHVALQRAMIAAQRGEVVALDAFDGAGGALAPELASTLDGAGTRLQVRAQLAALVGDRERALAWLERAVEDPNRASWLGDFVEFEPLRGDARFEAAIEDLTERLAAVDPACSG